tara:strand:- start:171 stop:1703 length:1533 start_codon:yes stop_codon:yes gene_type:complete
MKIVVDVSDYYRTNYWGGVPHRFYLNEFKVINGFVLDTKFPTTSDDVIGADMANYVDVLKSLKPGSNMEGKRYRNMALPSWYYYNRLGIGMQGHIWTNNMLEKTSFYDGSMPGEFRSTVIFDRFGSYIWRVMEKLALASDRRIPIKITELDWVEENYCKQFANVGSTSAGPSTSNPNNYINYISEPVDSHFDENHPAYKICKDNGELDANGGLGHHLFKDDEQMEAWGFIPEYLNSCTTAAQYKDSAGNRKLHQQKTKDTNGNEVQKFRHRDNYEVYPGNIDTLYELKAYHLTNLYYKLYSHPQITGVTQWSWANDKGGYKGIWGHSPIEVGLDSSNFQSDICESVNRRYYGHQAYQSSEYTDFESAFETIGSALNPMVSAAIFYADSDQKLRETKASEAHKSFVSQHDWIGEITSDNRRFTVPFGTYDIFINNIKAGSVEIPIEVSGVFNESIWSDGDVREDYVSTSGNVTIGLMSGEDSSNVFTTNGDVYNGSYEKGKGFRIRLDIEQ